MKKNFLFAALTAAFLSVANYAAAQVTIGGSDAPKAGTILDLNSTTKGGLVLSNVSLTDLEKIPAGQLVGITAEQDVNTDLTGIVVYNTNALLKLEVSQENSIDMPGRGIYVWDGNKWNKIGAPEHSITFAPYNLGADPAYDTPKKQIEYLAACSATDAIKVYGDLYQWGRVADGHEKRNSTTYSGPLTVPDDVDGNGQPNGTSGAIGKFITISGASDNWLTTPKHDLWGNGESLVGQTDNQGGVLYTDGKYYQNTDWTISASNPCASMGAGWRVPTQDEWERLINYDGDPVTVGGDITMDATGQANSSANSAPLTWVPVAGGIASTNWETDTEQKLGGYAVYKTADWDDAAAADYKNGIKNLYETAAPEPILFLPATGYRTGGGSVSEGGNIGYYWSSTVDTFNGEDVSYSFFGDIHGLSFWQDIRVFGDAVRCVKE